MIDVQQGQGWLQKLDTRASLVCCFGLSCEIAIFQNLLPSLSALLLALCLLIFSGLPLRFIIKRLAAANFFILFIWLVTPWTTPGQIACKLGPFAVSWNGLNLSLLVTIKANALAGLFIALISAQNPSALGSALSKLGLSDKLVWMFLLMGRNVDILHKEWSTLRDALKLRAFNAGTNLYSYKVIATMVAILFARAGERGERMYEAMLLRGFDGHMPIYVQGHFNRRDQLFILFCVLYAIFMAWLAFNQTIVCL